MSSGSQVEGDELHSFDFTHMQLDSLSDNADMKLITLMIFPFQVIKHCKSSLSEKMGNSGLHVVICCRLERSAGEDSWETLNKGAATYSKVKKLDAETTA